MWNQASAKVVACLGALLAEAENACTVKDGARIAPRARDLKSPILESILNLNVRSTIPHISLTCKKYILRL